MVRKLLVAAAVAAIASPITAFAADDGQIGPDSTGSTDVSIEKPVAVQISNVDDLDFGEHAFIPEGEFLEMEDPVCIFSTTSVYTLEVSNGSSAGADFELIGQNTAEAVPFEFLWSSGETTAQGTNSPASFPGNVGDSVSPSCFNSSNATIGARIQSADYNIAPPDTYTASVVLFVVPE